jgi:hypothetical protein
MAPRAHVKAIEELPLEEALVAKGIARNTTPEMSALYHADLSKLAAKRDGRAHGL